MFPYTEKYTESGSDIQNNDSLYKTHQKYQNTLIFCKIMKKNENMKKCKFLVCYMYKFHNSYFGFTVNFVNVGIFVYFVCLFIVEGHTASLVLNRLTTLT